MNIGIWGAGIEGAATGKVLEKAHKVYYYDVVNKKGIKLSSATQVVNNCAIIFITVPTPMTQSGKVDLDSVMQALMEIDKELYCRNRSTKPNTSRIIIIKSTVVPGTIEKFTTSFPLLTFAHNPEFLRQAHAYKDMLNSKRIVLGVDKNKTFTTLRKLYRAVFKDVPIIKATFAEAEIVKYASNIMLAGQIALANELYQICQQLKIDYKIIEKTLSYDKRIGTNIKMPGLDGRLGFGGECFPKDLNALIYRAREAGYRAYLLEEIWRLNLRVRKGD